MHKIQEYTSYLRLQRKKRKWVCITVSVRTAQNRRCLYQLNNENLVYSEMGERLANQRNHFAHGDLDKDFIGLSLLDLIYVEYVIYALQLKHYGVADDCIRKLINDLFHLNFAL